MRPLCLTNLLKLSLHSEEKEEKEEEGVSGMDQQCLDEEQGPEVVDRNLFMCLSIAATQGSRPPVFTSGRALPSQSYLALQPPPARSLVVVLSQLCATRERLSERVSYRRASWTEK